MLFSQEQELKPSLTEGTCLMETDRKNTEASQKEKMEITKPNRGLHLCPFSTEKGWASLGAPGLAGF